MARGKPEAIEKTTWCERRDSNPHGFPRQIQKLAGHSSIVISQRYVHADREFKQSAIRLLDKLNEPQKIVPSDTIEENLDLPGWRNWQTRTA